MKEICLLNSCDTVSKLKYSLGIESILGESGENVQGYKFITINDGDNSIKFVRNYNPYFICKEMSIDKVNNLGYEVVACSNDLVVFHKNSGVKYTVKPLEKIEDICKKFSVDKEYIISTNNLKTDKLFVGQLLII